MANTTNFGWETPDDTDLVKDGALAMRTLGNAIDTSFVDLKGGTTGQNLRKATNTDLDFTWAGDATNTVIDAEGDLLVGDSADTLQRLAIGTTGQVLTVDTAIDGKIKWAAAAAGGKVLQVVQDTSTTNETTTSATFTDTALSQAITPSATSSKVLVIAAFTGGIVRTASDDTNALYNLVRGSTQLATTLIGLKTAAGNSVARGFGGFVYLDSPNTTSATTYKIQFKADNGTAYMAMDGNFASLTLIEIGA